MTLRCGVGARKRGDPHSLLVSPPTSSPAVHNDLFMIADSCDDCGTANDLVVSAPGLSNLTGGLDPDRSPSVQVAWALASCAPLIQGGVGWGGWLRLPTSALLPLLGLFPAPTHYPSTY